MVPFKRYYNLPLDTNLIIDDGFGIREFRITQISGRLYRFEIIPLRDVSEYSFEFIVRKNGRMIYRSGATAESVDEYEFTGRGIYTVSCVLTHASGEKEIDALAPLRIRRK